MKEEPLHPWIEPELEARITALVLGEASDFEREELEHLIKERAELALFRKRTESLHGLLQEIATGESADDNDDWKLSDEKRSALLAVISGEVEAEPEESVVKETATKPKARRGSFLKTLTQIAALLFVMALIAGLMIPSFKKVIEPAGYKLAATAKRETSRDELFADNGDRASASFIMPPKADAAAVAKPDHKAISKSSLSAIQQSLGQYAAVTADQEKGTSTSWHDSKYAFSTARNTGELSFPDMNDRADSPARPTFPIRSMASSSGLDQLAGSGGGGGAASDPFASAGIDIEMASADPFAAPSRDGAAQLSDIGLGRPSPFDDAAPGARKPQTPSEVSDKRLAQSNNQISPSAGQLPPQIGMVAATAKADQGASIVGGMVSSETVAIGQVGIAGKKEASKSRTLTEGKTALARGQISARGKMNLADSQPISAGTLRVSRSDKLAKTKAKQDFDAFANNAPAKSGPAPAAAPMPAIQEDIADVIVTANQKPQDRETRRRLVGTDSPRAAEEDVAMEMVEKKKVMNKENRENQLQQVKNRAEMKAPNQMKAPKQIEGREMTWSYRGRQSAIIAKTLDSLAESENMTRKTKGNKDAAHIGDELVPRSKSAQFQHLAYAPQQLLKRQVKSEMVKLIPVKKSAPTTGLNEKNAEDEAFSTFSLHVSDVSFKLAQAALAKGEWPDASKVRIEEFVNAFDYGDPMPNQNEKVASQMEQSIHPFLQQRNLLRVSMRTAAAGRSSETPLRLTFLLDNSGSMERSDRQQTVQRAFALLAQQLQPMDQVTLISFARQPRLLADKVSGSKSNQLVNIVSNIPSEGGTNLEAALKLAFEKAQEQQIDNAQNRIIMLTDGAANLGNANPENLSKMIEGMRDAGIAFDAAGIGADGLNDEILEALTRKGDGRYYLLDQPEDADDGFARQIAGALRPAAKNVKVQIEFNPNRVGKYKLLGFEKHRLKKEDFRNDKVDAAEMAAAEAGVAVYQFEAKPDGEGDVGSVSVRFRDMSTGQMIENRWPIPYEADAPRIDQAAPSLRIASTAALLAAKLKGEPLGGSVELQTLSNLIAALPDRQRNTKRVQELQQMINQARQVSGK